MPHRRRLIWFSVREKRTVVKEAYASENNLKATARKYSILPEHIRRWSRQFI